MDQQRHDLTHGCCIRAFSRCARHRHGGHGGVFSFCDEGLWHSPVYRMGAPFSHNRLAALPRFRRSDHRRREPADTCCEKYSICRDDRLFPVHLPDDAGYSPGTLYGSDGGHHDGGGLHLCRDRRSTEKRPCDHCGNHVHRWDAAACDPGDRTWLELFQAPA